MRRAVIAGALVSALVALGVACTKVVVVTNDPATAEAASEIDGDPIDVGAACAGRGAASVEFAATMGKGRTSVACRAPVVAVATIDAGVLSPDAPVSVDAPPAVVPALSTFGGVIGPEATHRIPGRPVPAGCTARYGGRRARPAYCPDCTPRLVTTVDLACAATTIRIEADGHDLTATCERLACDACAERVQAFVGDVVGLTYCEETPAAAP